MALKGVASCLVINKDDKYYDSNEGSGIMSYYPSLNQYHGAPAKNRHWASLMCEYHLHTGKGGRVGVCGGK